MGVSFSACARFCGILSPYREKCTRQTVIVGLMSAIVRWAFGVQSLMRNVRRHCALLSLDVGSRLRGTGDMQPTQESNSISFWKIYGTVMAIDLILYVLIFYVGSAIPSAPGASAPGNIGLVMYWLIAHLPAVRIFWVIPTTADSWMWLLVLQDAWLAGLIYLWRRGRSRHAHVPRPRVATGSD